MILIMIRTGLYLMANSVEFLKIESVHSLSVFVKILIHRPLSGLFHLIMALDSKIL